MDKIDKAADVIAKIVEWAVILLFTITLSCCVLQVFTRYVMNHSLRWTDELARYTFIYGNVLGAVLMQRIHGHAAVTFLVGCLPKMGQKILAVLTNILMLGISCVLVYSGLQVVQRTTKQLSPGMGIPLCYLYLCIVIGGGLFAFFILIDLIHQCKNLNQTELNQADGGGEAW